jgi:hypothetical protein
MVRRTEDVVIMVDVDAYFYFYFLNLVYIPLQTGVKCGLSCATIHASEIFRGDYGGYSGKWTLIEGEQGGR